MDDDRPKTIRLTHPAYGLVLCTPGDEAPWLGIGYQVEGSAAADAVDAAATALVKPKQIRVRMKKPDVVVDAGDASDASSEVSL